MLRSMFSSVAGLRAHQTMMDVTANNISNINTTGFKSSRATFAETLVQTIRGGSGPAAERGGVNALQLGLGSRVASIDTNLSQGALLVTNRDTDLAIQGDGFFIVNDGNTPRYTRAGAFRFDASGTLVTVTGERVQGWLADPTTGITDTGQAAGDIVIPAGALAPDPTTELTLGGNLPAGAAVGDSRVATSVVYDSLGTHWNVTTRFTNTGVGTWDVNVSYVDAAGATVDITPAGATATFGPDGVLTSAPTITVGPVAFGNGNAQTVDINLGGGGHAVTQFDRDASIDMVARNGSEGAELTNISFAQDGSIIGEYSNGVATAIGRLAMANFANPEGLTRSGDNMFSASVASGDAQIGVAGEGEFGVLSPGSLEGSNVDLAQEFTNLVIAQRGFSANSRVITTSDEMLQDLVNIKR